MQTVEKLIQGSVVISIFCVMGCTSAPVNPWSIVKGPSAGNSESIGKYDAGCLSGGKELSQTTSGLIVMRPARKRYYGHPVMIRFLESLGQKSNQEKISPVLIGDMAQSRGGPIPQGHASHQTGLDVDVWFYRPWKAALDPSEKESVGAESYLKGDPQDLKNSRLDESKWGLREDALVRLAAESEFVERIFVHPRIKEFLCSHYQGRPWLRKVRPWYRHDDHLHVRLECPIDSSDCQRQSKPPEGDGCDSTLAWWFTEEAVQEAQKNAQANQQATLSILPERCQNILND